MNNPRFICEFCYEPIGRVDLDKLNTPMTPDMFLSINAARQIPPPFHPMLEWLDFKCPICKLRPFYTENHVTIIDDDNHRSSVKASQKFKCECGKEYQHESSLTRHQKEAHGR